MRIQNLIVYVTAAAAVSLGAFALVGAQASPNNSQGPNFERSRGFVPQPNIQPIWSLEVPSGPVAAPLPVGGPATTPVPLYGPTTEALISEQTARDKASLLAVGPITRQDVRLLPYRDVSDFAGSVITTIHPDRLFYMVVTAAPWQPTRGSGAQHICPSYIAVIDAENAHTRGIICGNAQWPTNLPAPFAD